MKRYNFTSLRITSTSQILKGTMDQKMQDFLIKVMHVYNRIIEEKYLVNMDRTNAYFNSLPQTTVHRKGDLTIFVKFGGSPSRLTLFVAAAKDGTKLPLFVVMKGEPVGRIEKSLSELLPHNMLVCR